MNPADFGGGRWLQTSSSFRTTNRTCVRRRRHGYVFKMNGESHRFREWMKTKKPLKAK